MVNLIPDLEVRGFHTPDFHELKRHTDIPLFVYGSYKSKEPNHKYLAKHAKYLGEGRTAISGYSLKENSDGEVVMFNEVNSQSYAKGYINGELYAVPFEVILILDQFLGNGYYFERTKKNILCLDQVGIKSSHKPYIGAQIYMGVPSSWRDKGLHTSPSYFVNKRHSNSVRERHFSYMSLDKKPEENNVIQYPLHPFGDLWD